jgi:hypothetical protein
MLSVNTPDGVKSGFDVVQVDYWEVGIPARGEAHKTHGQELYLDLGPGHRPLIALLTHIRRANERPEDIHWLEDDPIRIMARLCLHVTKIYSWIDVASQFGACRGPYQIKTSDLPDLATFADADDPQSIMLVNPNDLSATLGAGVSWDAMTIEATDQALTNDLKKRLPWIKNITLFPKIPAIQSFMQLENTFYNRDFVRDGD